MAVLMIPAELHARVARVAALKATSVEAMILDACEQRFRA